MAGNPGAGPTAVNVRGTVGLPLPATEVSVVDPLKKYTKVPDGTRGLILVRGPQVPPRHVTFRSARVN
eukprot:8723494-Pyramimonas_sp.AAC.1